MMATAREIAELSLSLRSGLPELSKARQKVAGWYAENSIGYDTAIVMLKNSGMTDKQADDFLFWGG